MPTISELLRSCLDQLTGLVCWEALAEYQSDIPLQAWKDELGRLRVWAANIGSHQTGQSSLDYRLRDASHIKTQTVKVLEALQYLLEDLALLLAGEYDAVADHEEAEDEKPLHEERQGLYEDLKLDDSHATATEVKEIHQSLVDKVSQLYDISVIIRKPAQHDRLIGTEKVDEEAFKPWMSRHVSDKLPQADGPIVDRISFAMARQKAILKYRERHHMKLSQGIEDADNETVKLSETVATSFQVEAVYPTSDELISNAAASEATSYARSLLAGDENLTIPAPPKESVGQRPFQCPYCYFIITTKDRHAWARHVFRDLSPYICIFPECPTQNKLYESRKSWYRHIRQIHVPADDTSDVFECVLCREGPLPSVTFERHVGRHLEELSLFVLPRTDEDDEDNDDESAATGNDQILCHACGGVWPRSPSGMNCPNCSSDFTEIVDVSHDTKSEPNPTATREQSSYPPGFNTWADEDYSVDEDQMKHIDASDRRAYEKGRTPKRSALQEFEQQKQEFEQQKREFARLRETNKPGPGQTRGGGRMEPSTVSPIGARPENKLGDRYSCRICLGNNVISRSILKHHISACHYSDYKYKCPLCSHYNYRKDKLKSHWNHAHRQAEELSGSMITENAEFQHSPTNCHFCDRQVHGWDDFFQCVLDHCRVIGDEGPSRTPIRENWKRSPTGPAAILE